LARDDVGVESVQVQGQLVKVQSNARLGGTDSLVENEQADQAGAVVDLTQVAERRDRLTVQDRLDLTSMQLVPGDELIVSALARDVYEIDGRRHEPVRSSPRRLRVIDTEEFVGQIRTELAGLRQRAVRMTVQQEQLAALEPQQALGGQQRLGRQVDAQSSLVDSLEERVQRNRLKDRQLQVLLKRSIDLLNRARRSSADAVAKLSGASRATQQQIMVGQALSELVSLLDQGRDVLTLKLKLRELGHQQQTILTQTHGLTPQTLGQSPDELEAADREHLAKLGARQAALAEQASRLTRQMQVAAGALALQEGAPEQQASAEALAQAAAIAQRQGLVPRMNRAAEAATRNQLASSSQMQTGALGVVGQMLEKLQQTEGRRQEILHRILEELSQAIERLAKQQRSQLLGLEKSKRLRGLDAPLSVLRRNTLAVQQRAQQTQEAADSAELLGRAASSQGLAVTALRDEQRQPAILAESEALTAIGLALEKVRQMRDQAQMKITRRQREQLMAEYNRLAREQDEVSERTRPYTVLASPSRRQRAAMIELSYEQADLRIAAGELKERVSGTLVFSHMHDQIDRLTREVSRQLREVRTNPQILDRQQQVSSFLRTMAASLQQEERNDPFVSSSSGVGGGGGPSASGRLVPSLAELKALRGMQEIIYLQTRSLGESDRLDVMGQQRQFIDLAAHQHELAELGRRLIEHMRRVQMPAGILELP